MKLLTLPEIQTYIKNWQKIRTDASELKKYLLYADSFSYKIENKPSEIFHVYPGVCLETETLYIFLIDAKMDQRKKYDSIIQCKIEPNLGNSESPLPSREALEMIYKWQKNREEWIDKKINTKYGVFRAFSMPADYMVEGAEYETFFSLKENSNNDEVERDADLVTMRKNFYDVVRPVPPFGGGGVEESDFNL